MNSAYVQCFCQKCSYIMNPKIIDDEIKFLHCSNEDCENHSLRFHPVFIEIKQFTPEENKKFAEDYSNVVSIS